MREERREAVEAAQSHEGSGMPRRRRRHEPRPRRGQDPPVGQQGPGRDDDLVDAGHDREDGGVRDQGRSDPGPGERDGRPPARVARGGLGDDDLERAALGCLEEEEQRSRVVAEGQDDLVGVDVVSGLFFFFFFKEDFF